ncbi:MAG: phosphate transport system regulatory protein PhoU [Candidatus Reconcilbacillus cellulovorans]|uniref:Phosphate-specific transport system accessory protein PhoU n=1 Tax=Candidatus Reconcilbacillus cellulovorans TaxID=1906605 RepID=A0A2A6E383_9BACL|nr:MAG: phosphate transport system regulatory protein PhoU [Candidatus Reconcilbacillus cellulovorans]
MITSRRPQFDDELGELRDRLVAMGKEVEQAIDDAVRSLKTQNGQLARRVVDGDVRINAMEVEIDETASRLIATQQPVAKDLRRILAAFKMAGDLERMADLAVDIAKVTIRIGSQPLVKPLIDIPRMAEIVRRMTAESIAAYIDENVDLAYKMAQLDDEVDQLHSQVMREMFAYMVENPKSINQAMLLCFVSRYLERMADHATNLGESVVYLVRGERPDLNQ